MKESNLHIYACPSCRGPLEVQGEEKNNELWNGLLLCKPEGITYPLVKGVPNLILPVRKTRVEAHIKEMARLRDLQGLSIDDWSYYLHLPYPEKTRGRYGNNPSLLLAPLHRHWAQRAYTFEKLYNLVRFEEGLTVLDLGAGSGWLANRLSNRFDAVAIDIDSGPHSLGACQAFLTQGKHIERCQGELANLPLQPHTADIAILNAAAEYEDFPLIAGEALRVLKPNGTLYITDSPVFTTPSGHLNAQTILSAYYEVLDAHLLKERHQPLLLQTISEELKHHCTIEVIPGEHPITAAKRSLRRVLSKDEIPIYPIIRARKLKEGF